MFKLLRRALALLATLLALSPMALHAQEVKTSFGWQKVGDLQLFYREAGPSTAPTLVFLHGNPLSSIMYESVMEQLASSGRVHVIAVDYPSFGFSDAPNPASYRYTFDQLAQTVRAFIASRGIKRYALYMQDYGVPIGFRLATLSPEAITALIVQNGVIHLDGFPSAQDPQGELRQHWAHRNAAIDRKREAYIRSLPFPQVAEAKEEELDPDVLAVMTAAAQRPGVAKARTDLWFDYGTNVARYPQWQALLRNMKVPMLVIWGRRDDFFTVPGAFAYLRDAPDAELHVIDAGHFATLEQPSTIATLTLDFFQRHQDQLR